MSFLPIVERELRVAGRRPATYWIRLGFALVGAGIVGLALLFAGVAQTGGLRIGGGLFYFLSLLALAFSAFAGVFLTADCLSEEKREGTLGLLFLTDLAGYDVVIGKLLARSLSASYGLLAVFPVLAITLTMGGVSPGEFWRMTLVFLNTIFFSLTAGMFVSSLSRHDHRAMAAAAALVVFIGGALPLAEFVLNKVGLAARFALSLPSPLTAWQLAFDAPFRMWGRSFCYSLLLTQALSWSFLALAAVLLPRRWQTGSNLSSDGRPVAPDAWQAARAAQRRSLLAVNPVYWLTVRKSRLAGASAAIWTVMIGGLAGIFYGSPMASFVKAQYGWPVLLVLLRIFVGVYACRFFAEARRAGSLELLMCTPLTVREILWGQWLALRRLFLVPAIGMACAAVLPLMFMFMGDPDNSWPAGMFMGGLYLYALPKLICDLLAAAWVGMLLGLTAKRPNLAPGLTVLYTVVLPVAAFCVPDVIISLPLSLWAREKLYRELRALSSPRPTFTPLYAPANPIAKPPAVLKL